MSGEARLAGAQACLQNGERPTQPYHGPVHVGVDLGTAYLVMLVLDEAWQPLAGRSQFAQVVRDGLVVDFMGAIDHLTAMKTSLERQLGFALTSAATAYPPGVSTAEVRATENVLYGAGLVCSGLIDEPSAANKVLEIENGAVVDIGGGTTGIAIIKNGEVVYTADEPTGGTHFSLVIAGANNITFAEAEAIKQDSANHQRLYPLIRPVMEKVATIINRHIAAHAVEAIHLVGGSSNFGQIASVVEELTTIPTQIADYPMLVTPLGIAMSN